MTKEQNRAMPLDYVSWGEATSLERVTAFLEERHVPFAFSGSYLKEVVRDGDLTQASDIDVSVCLRAWNEGLSRHERNQFELAANHQRYLARLAVEGKAAERMVYRLRDTAELLNTFQQTARQPFEISALVDFTSAKKVAESASIGVHQTAFGDGKFWATLAYHNDMANKTLTVMHCPDVRAAKQTILRLDSLLDTRFKGWESRWGSAANPFMCDAFGALKAEGQTLKHFNRC